MALKLFLGLIMASLFQGVPKAQLPCQASIIFQQPEAGQLSVQAQCQNNTAAEFRIRYDMVQEKQGPSGSTSNRQSGWATVGAGQRKILSSIRLSMQPADAYSVQLRIFDQQGQLVAQDSLVRPAR
ncbi:hypothetical protein SAMN02746009_02040 [Hymenobacter psychrotolerans DSM 18569]|uniref:Curli assembly protein CsgC n=2 Tax=Hymenobacter psychrotolerans TaxID=344998 RepID=A0A1M6XGY2_9BACT|nr:hypothetical protein SAMN02746009_02040 [Hymenobacter psychrotolerans DSM 18569]